MAATLTLIGLLGGIGAAAGGLLAWVNRRFPPDRSSIIAAIDAVLPQTQCAQCGYPGCRPYAEAVAAGAAIDLCPPGGAATALALANLLGRPVGIPPVAEPAPVARIDETRCIGCYLCVPACPVDAIVGAPQFMHTVLAEQCTGCELCIAPCPVDCIELLPRPVEVHPRPIRIMSRPRNLRPDEPEEPCIRCGLCVPACPVDLLPQELLWYAAGDDLQGAADRGLDRCIECGLCNQVCPSNIDLLTRFTRGRQGLAAEARQVAEAASAKAAYDRRLERLASRATARESRRRQRMQRAGDRSWQP